MSVEETLDGDEVRERVRQVSAREERPERQCRPRGEPGRQRDRLPRSGAEAADAGDDEDDAGGSERDVADALHDAVDGSRSRTGSDEQCRPGCEHRQCRAEHRHELGAAAGQRPIWESGRKAPSVL